jgi:glutamate:GABA antiporter
MAFSKAPAIMSKIDQRSPMLRSERIAGGLLPKVLGSFDMVAIFIAIVLWIPNASTVAGAGPAAFIYWGLGFMTCLIPGAIVTGQLGLMFPGEGSIYIWTTKAFGNLVGFLGGFCSWWPGILVIITAGDSVVIFIQSLGHLYHLSLLPDSGSQGLVILLVITISFLLSILRFRITQNLVNMIFLTYSTAILLIGLAGAIWLVTGHPSNTDFSFTTGRWALSGSNITFYGTVILALLGIEVPLNMGVEIKDTSSITRYLLWGSVVVIAAYLIVTFGLMIAVPLKDQTSAEALMQAILRGFGPLGLFLATMVNVFLIGFFIFVSAVYNYSFARLLFVSGLDRRLPASISKINANKVPWIAVLAQSALAALLAAFIFIIAPIVIPTNEVSRIMYNILLAAATIFWSLSMIFLFIDVITIRHKFRSIFRRIRLAPDWIFTLCAIVGTIANGVGIVVIFSSPWTNSPGNTLLSTTQWDIWMAAITIIALIIATTVYFIGQQTIRQSMSDAELIAEVT